MDTASSTLTRHDQRVITARARVAVEMEDYTHVQDNGRIVFQRHYFRGDFDIPLATASRAHVAVTKGLGAALFFATVAAMVGVYVLLRPVHESLAGIASMAAAAVGVSAGIVASPYRRRAWFRPDYAVSAQMIYAFRRAAAAVVKERTTRPGALELLADFEVVYPGFQELVREFDALTFQIQRERSWVNEETRDADAATFARHDQVQSDMYDVLAQVIAAAWTLRETPAPGSGPGALKKAPVPTVLSDGAQQQMREALARIAAASA